MCVVFYSAYTFPNRKVKSGVGELREGSLNSYNTSTVPILYVRVALQLLGEQKPPTVDIRYWLEIIIFNFLITTL